MKVTLLSPNNRRIVGIVEIATGVALIEPDSVDLNEKGDVEFLVEHGSFRVDEKPRTLAVDTRGQRQFVDEDGVRWSESALKRETFKPSKHYLDGFQAGVTWPDGWDHKPGGPSFSTSDTEGRKKNREWLQGWEQGKTMRDDYFREHGVHLCTLFGWEMRT